jgi:L-fuculose-phosphate aldolase
MQLADLRAEVLKAGLRMVADGCAHGAQGNISARDPETGLIAITPSAIPYDEMQIEDIAVISHDGEIVTGRWQPTSEMPMHTVLYRERPDVGAVVHSHAPHATVFALIHEPIPLVLTEAAACLGEPVRVARYVQPGTKELGGVALETMGSGVAVLLANHGLLTVGDNLAQAYDATLAAETTARLVIMARSMGAAPVGLSPDAVAVMRDGYLHGYRPSASASARGSAE